MQLSVSPVAGKRITILAPNVGPLHLTTVQVPVLVNQTQNSANPTQQLVVGPKPSRPSKCTRILAGKVVNRKAETTTETVRKMCPPPVPTTIQVIGTVTLDTINYQDFVQTFKSANQQNQ